MSSKSKTSISFNKQDGHLEKLEENRIKNNGNNGGLFNENVNHQSKRESD